MHPCTGWSCACGNSALTAIGREGFIIIGWVAMWRPVQIFLYDWWPLLRYADAREVLVGIATDPVFGPAISFGAGGVAVEALRDTALALPPLNGVLARELIGRTRVARILAQHRDVPAADAGALEAILEGVSRMACALPWSGGCSP